MKEFNFEIMVTAPNAKLACFETAGYLDTLLRQQPQYKAKSSIRQNLKVLLSLLLPAAPWVGPPLSSGFRVTWHNVMELLRGKTAIACVHLRGESSFHYRERRVAKLIRHRYSPGKEDELRKWKKEMDSFLASLPEDTRLKLERQAELDIPGFLREREERILRLYKHRHKEG